MGQVIWGIFLSLRLGENPVRAFSILQIWVVVSIAGLAGIEPILFLLTKVSLQPHVDAYQIAQEVLIKERLPEDQQKLRIEIASLKSPQRIEAIAKDRLQMYYFASPKK